MADALDSKSGSLWECGFKSHLRYQFFCDFTLKCQSFRVIFYPDLYALLYALIFAQKKRGSLPAVDELVKLRYLLCGRKLIFEKVILSDLFRAGKTACRQAAPPFSAAFKTG